MFKSFKSSSTVLIWQGIMAVVVGIIARWQPHRPGPGRCAR